jgi:hypothetical protein
MKTISFDGVEIYPIKPWQEYQRLLGALEDLRNVRERLALFAGEQGVGKTLGAMHFCEAHRHAVRTLEDLALAAADRGGAREPQMKSSYSDRISVASDGTELFLERRVWVRLEGKPEVAQEVAQGVGAS